MTERTPPASIVIVEDDQAIAQGLELNLRFEGHRVRVAHTGDAGLDLALEPGVDLVILDVMLPGRHGYDILRELRRRDCQAAVLMLSAKGAEADRVRGLDLGADDYLAKPFSLPELLARVRALLRRRGTPRRLRVGEIEVDLGAQVAVRDGHTIPLTTQEFRLLRALIEANGRVLSREQLLDRAWGLDYEGTARTVDTFMRQLRTKVETNPDDPRHLLTVRGSGYRFEP